MSTKKLAKELGLVRKHNKSSTGPKKILVSNQIFTHLIVIDFESTCWREKNNFGQEIIEFPAVLLNTSTGEVESQFQTYVQPQEHPVLSEFCTELTGITQAQVEVGVPLQICLSRFSRWLQTLQLQRGVVFPGDQRGSCAPSLQKPCAFLTWSDWDLGVCLQYECKRKQLNKPDVLNSWIDLRATYKLFYSRKPKGLNGALQDLGIQFAGREHSGLDDALNTARLAVRMMRDGCVLKITRSPERAPLKAKPLFGNISDRPGNDKENNDTKPEAPAAISRSSLNVSRDCPQKDLLLENIKPVNDTNKNSYSIYVDYQSLVSPKTLLNGLTTPLYGTSNRSRMVRVGTNFSSPITVNIPSPHNSVVKSSSICNLVLFPTTVDCMPHPLRPQLTFETEATTESRSREVMQFLEIEEGCGSYDDVVLECDEIEDAYPEDERFDTDPTLLCDTESYLSTEPTLPVPIGYPNNVAHRVTAECKTLSAVFAVPKPPASSHTTAFQKGFCSSTTTNSILVRPNKLLSNTAVQGPSKSFSTSSNIIGSRLHSKTIDLSHASSTSCASFARPISVAKEFNTSAVHSRVQTQRKNKTSFTIYTDLEKHSTPAVQLPLSKSRSVVPPPLSSSTNRSPNRSSLSINRSSSSMSSKAGMCKITSPLCGCGRRAKRQTVANGGPNHGRVFYCCPVRRSGNKNGKGCKFFKWESALIKKQSSTSVAAGSSISLCFDSSCLPAHTLSSRKSW